MKETVKKYKAFPGIKMDDRTWPSNTISTPPIWCSVDLRDGNQALIEPMSVEQKAELFKALVNIGFKEIEIGFPSASEIEFQFMRKLIEEKMIPEDVTVQVLVQARRQLLERTFESLKGARRAIVHLYNSTSPAQREIVFGMEREEIAQIAVDGVRMVKEMAAAIPETEIVLQYSPESFSATELDFALDVCNRVIESWSPEGDQKIIINLPATVEVATPNVHADQIEWMSRNLSRRENVIISVHAHNDRGCAVAASELAQLAGADRVEGTLFGNGERTGNADLVTLAMNCFSQGIDPGLDFSDIDSVVDVYRRTSGMEVHPRHPYAGELVYTAFSGSHQDAIKKGLAAYGAGKRTHWDVPYLPIDPQDVGRDYEAVIRINSQSGKGGIAYILEKRYGYELPKAMANEFRGVVQKVADASGSELEPEQIMEIFTNEYFGEQKPYAYGGIRVNREREGVTAVTCTVQGAPEDSYSGEGNGVVDALVHALSGLCPGLEVVTYDEHALGEGSDASAVAYIGAKNADGVVRYGVGKDSDIVVASARAIICACNRF